MDAVLIEPVRSLIELKGGDERCDMIFFDFFSIDVIFHTMGDRYDRFF